MIHQEKIFSKEECNLIIKYGNQYKDLQIKIKGNAILSEENRLTSTNNFFMKYNVFLIPMNQETTWLYDRLFKWIDSVANIKIIEKIDYFHCTLHRYKTDDGFGKHIDLITGHENRRYNIGIQLNENYEGGEYICWDNLGNEILISKEAGTALVYHCTIPHEIKKITKGERWSLVMPIKKNMIVECKKSKLI